MDQVHKTLAIERVYDVPTRYREVVLTVSKCAYGEFVATSGDGVRAA